jgi:ankyrin repeat protein
VRSSETGWLASIGPVFLWIGLAAAASAADPDDRRIADAAMNRDMAAVRSFVREGADPNGRGAYGTPPLLWVVRVQDHDTVTLLLDAGADPNLSDAQGLPPLHLAVENEDRETVLRLLGAGADVDRHDHTGETALFIAARLGEVDIAKILIEHGAEADFRERAFEQTPLHVAARSGSLATARLLIEHGARIEARTLAGEVPRFRLPGENAGSKGVGIIRGGWPERGSRPPVPGAMTPLLYATRTGDLEMVRLFVDAGADIEQGDANGIRPLLNAILNGSVASIGRASEHLEIARFLVDRGAEVNSADWYGETPLWAAVDLRDLDVTGPVRDNGIDRPEALALIHLLLERGADPNARTREYPPERSFITRLGSLSWADFTGQTPFLRAALAGDTEVMQLLVDHGADANIATDGGTTPLMAAAGINWVVNQTFDEGPDALLAAVKLAHALGNDVNAVNSMGLRAIHGAANRGSDAVIEYLVANDAALDAADREGRTPMDWAKGVFLATHPPVRKPQTIAALDAFGRAR